MATAFKERTAHKHQNEIATHLYGTLFPTSLAINCPTCSEVYRLQVPADVTSEEECNRLVGLVAAGIGTECSDGHPSEKVDVN